MIKEQTNSDKLRSYVDHDGKQHIVLG